MKEVNNDIEPSTSSTDANRPIKNEESNKRKRRASDAVESNLSAKRFVAPADDDDGIFKLLDFTDEVLLEILHNCDSTTLYALSKTCKHFLKLVEDRRLWKTFDFSTKRMMGRQIKKLLSAIQIGDINEFKVRGFVTKYPSEKWTNNTITVNILRKLSSACPLLETMEIREGYINFQKVKIADFPATLKHLIFYGCQTTLPRSPRLFTKIDEYLQLLEEISLEKCPWFETHDLVVFSKLPHLKRLILRGCSTLKGCVPYGSIATRFGFKSLEYLDVRDTPISDSDIQCFNITTTLREIKMDCPVEFRENYNSSDETISDTDDSESYEPKLPNNDSIDEPMKNSSEKGKEDSNSNKTSQTHHRDDSIFSESESESDDETDCSTDSEDGNSDDGEDGGAKVSGSNDDTSAPHQAHCIQVILQNGRMINVNAERSNEFDSPMRETNGLHCVIGIINGRDSNDRVFAAPLRYQRQSSNQNASADGQNQNESNTPSNPRTSKNGSASSSSEKSNSPDTDSKAPATNSTNADANPDGGSQPGPSGLQTNQNDSTKAPKSNSSENANATANNNANDEAGPSNRQQQQQQQQAVNAPNENRQRLIIVQHRRSPNNDENGNMNRQISWEVRNLYPIADTPYRTMRYQNTMLNGSGNYITDRGMCSFGMPRRNVQENIIWIRAELRPPDTLLERITVRNYLDVTDVTLRHLALCAPNLRYLDVTGTSVTLKGINTFLKEKPDCQIVSELLDT